MRALTAAGSVPLTSSVSNSRSAMSNIASSAAATPPTAHGEVVLERDARELRHDRRLLAASYLGEAAGPTG